MLLEGFELKSNENSKIGALSWKSPLYNNIRMGKIKQSSFFPLNQNSLNKWMK